MLPPKHPPRSFFWGCPSVRMRAPFRCEARSSCRCGCPPPGRGPRSSCRNALPYDACCVALAEVAERKRREAYGQAQIEISEAARDEEDFGYGSIVKKYGNFGLAESGATRPLF